MHTHVPLHSHGHLGCTRTHMHGNLQHMQPPPCAPPRHAGLGHTPKTLCAQTPPVGLFPAPGSALQGPSLSHCPWADTWSGDTQPCPTWPQDPPALPRTATWQGLPNGAAKEARGEAPGLGKGQRGPCSGLPVPPSPIKSHAQHRLGLGLAQLGSWCPGPDMGGAYGCCSSTSPPQPVPRGPGGHVAPCGGCSGQEGPGFSPGQSSPLAPRTFDTDAWEKVQGEKCHMHAHMNTDAWAYTRAHTRTIISSCARKHKHTHTNPHKHAGLRPSTYATNPHTRTPPPRTSTRATHACPRTGVQHRGTRAALPKPNLYSGRAGSLPASGAGPGWCPGPGEDI